ncbi:MAG: hypothetical protein QF535_10050 [Anaerolineales bacterium]|nr:hypothetical protein [Anaerolineales bacterium]
MAILQETTISGSVTHKEGTVATAGTTLTLDLSTGSSFEVDMESYTNNIDTLTVLNKTDTNHNRSFLLQVTQHTGSLNFTWSSINNVKWPGGTAPTLTTTNDKKDIYSFTTWDNGTTWYARIIGQNY